VRRKKDRSVAFIVSDAVCDASDPFVVEGLNRSVFFTCLLTLVKGCLTVMSFLSAPVRLEGETSTGFISGEAWALAWDAGTSSFVLRPIRDAAVTDGSERFQNEYLQSHAVEEDPRHGLLNDRQQTSRECVALSDDREGTTYPITKGGDADDLFGNADDDELVFNEL
jgi:hypothetical protein